MLFSENINLFNHRARTLQAHRRTDRQTDRIIMPIPRFAMHLAVIMS